MSPVRSLYLPEKSVESLVGALEQGRFSIHDRRAQLKWGVAWIYGLTAALVLALVAWRLLLWGGLAAMVAASDLLGDSLGVHPVVIFFAIAALGGVVLLVRLLRRNGDP